MTSSMLFGILQVDPREENKVLERPHTEAFLTQKANSRIGLAGAINVLLSRLR